MSSRSIRRYASTAGSAVPEHCRFAGIVDSRFIIGSFGDGLLVSHYTSNPVLPE
jgi:hypothetical protein